MPRSLGTGDGIEFKLLTLSTGQCASISMLNMECLFIDQANYVVSTMIEEFELETNDFQIVDDQTWQLFGEVATVWTNLRKRSSDKANNMLPEGNQLSGPDMKEILANTHTHTHTTELL